MSGTEGVVKEKRRRVQKEASRGRSGDKTGEEKKRKKRVRRDKGTARSSVSDVASMADTIASLKEQTEQCQQEAQNAQEEIEQLQKQNAKLQEELAKLNAKFAKSQERDLSALELRNITLQRALNTAQRDKNVLEQTIAKLEKSTQRYLDHAFVMMLVAKKLFTQSEQLEKQIAEEENVGADTLYIAFEILIQELTRKLSLLCQAERVSKKEFDKVDFKPGDYKYVDAESVKPQADELQEEDV